MFFGETFLIFLRHKIKCDNKLFCVNFKLKMVTNIMNFDLPPPFPFIYYISEAGGTRNKKYFACETKISEKYAFLRPYFACKSLRNAFLVIFPKS